jgi:hypothetical protein
MDPEYEDEYADTEEPEALVDDFAVPSAAEAYRAAQEAQLHVTRQVESNRKLLMDAAAKLREQRVGPSRAEQLFALSRAFSQPTSTGRFGERMGIVGEALSGQERAKREAEEKRELLLQKYGMAAGDEALKGLMSRATMAERLYGRAAQLQAAQERALATAGRRRTGFNPVTGELVYLDTGERVSAPAQAGPLAPPRIGEVKDGYAYMGGDPSLETSWRKVR